MNPLSLVREAVVRAVPEIMELKWGCHILVQGVDSVIVGKHLKEDYYYVQVGRNSSVEKIPGMQAGMRVQGRPITLADVLRAIETLRAPNSFKLSVDTKGYMTLFNYKWEPQSQADWNFTQPLEGQSQECLEFLAKLLTP